MLSAMAKSDQYQRLQATLESLRLTAGVLIDQALIHANRPEFQLEEEDEFHAPANPSEDLLRRLRMDLVDRIAAAQSDLQDLALGIDRQPNPHGEYGA
jgi:hypothetical protein